MAKYKVAAILVMALLTGCANLEGVGLAFSKYQEPTDGARARLRLLSDQPTLFVYPGSTCEGPDIVGAGVAAGSRTVPRGGEAYRKIGIPSAPVAGGAVVTEVYARAGQPITFTLTAGGCSQGRCPVDYRTCDETRTFVPAEGVDYVATILREGDSCAVQMFRIVPRGTGHGLVPHPSEVAGACAKR